MSPRILSTRARLSKLRAMSAAEIVHRVWYGARIAAERRQFERGRLAPDHRLHDALVADLQTAGWRQQLVASRRRHRTRFFPSVGAAEPMRALFATAYQTEHAATRDQANSARQQRFAFFGDQFHYPGEIDWQADPVSGRRWPPAYHADSRVHNGDVGYGDVKYVWELSRQQFVIDLGKAWFLSREPEDLRALERLVRSWIAGNPYATGVNWSCALEPAFRVISWLWAYYFTLEDLAEEFHLEWLAAFYDHARFIERHLEVYSSPYNHLIAEGAALYMAGACFPEFHDAGRWRRVGRGVLEDHLPSQFYADGGSVEQSTFYHHATVGFYLLAGILARATGDELSADVWAAIERGITFSVALSQPDGKTPPIGGADDGKPIRMEHLPFWDFRPYQAAGAVLFGRPDFKHVAGRFHEDALWLLGPDGLTRFEAIAARVPEATSVRLASSGYAVLRSDWSARGDYVCFDCGEQAAGMRTDAVPNSMHGHADCLSIIVTLRGQRVLVDSGLYAYNCGGAWEAHFRETAAHNTAKVDGRDQARHLNKMAWSDSYRATLERWSPQPDQAWVVGSHDGYARGRDGIVHRRAVWLRPDSYVLIYDEFVGSGEHDITVNYQFAPGELTTLGTDAVLFDNAVDLIWLSRDSWSADISSGGAGPDDGWIAPSLGVKQAAPRLRLTGRTSRPRTSLLTVIAARATPRARVHVAASEAWGTLAAVTTGNGVDVVAAQGISGGQAIDSDALLAVCGIGADGSLVTTSMDASRLSVDAEMLCSLAASHRRFSEPSRAHTTPQRSPTTVVTP